jgi:hypothetical protein
MMFMQHEDNPLFEASKQTDKHAHESHEAHETGEEEDKKHI